MTYADVIQLGKYDSTNSIGIILTHPRQLSMTLNYLCGIKEIAFVRDI